MRVLRHVIPCACIVGGLVTSASAQSAKPLSPRNANYTIDVQLDAPARTLRGHEHIVWRNITHTPTRELQFHLYWNAWTDTRSTWMRERSSRGEVRRPPQDFSRLSIDSLHVQYDADTPAADLTSAQHFIAPDDGNADDRTVMRVALAQPIGPNEQIAIDIEWNARVPRTFDRTGTIGHYFFLAQWFPKLGVLEDTGWNCHQFHAATEFFSDYGVYDVRMTVPSGWIVGATGTERERHDNGNGTTTHRYVQEDVHDFAWTTSPDFVVRTARFESQGLPPVDMRLLIQPEHLSQAERHFAAARAALGRYSTWFGPYPYGHLTIVDPAYQSETDGMEYPTLVTGGTSWLVSRVPTRRTPEEVVAHEVGHQFWYGIVGSNEFEHAWMDEGIDTYGTARVLGEDYPDARFDRSYFGDFIPWAFPDIPIKRETDWNRIWGYRAQKMDGTISNLSYRERPDSAGVFGYNKPAVWLNTIERWLGWPIVQRGLHDAFDEGAFTHPGPDVVLDSLQHAAGRDLSRFFDQTYRGAAVFDYAVDGLSSTPRDGAFVTRTVVRRLGDGVFPVDVLVVFDNGEQATEHWDGGALWHEWTYTKSSRARSVVVDPHRTLLLDVNFTNNSRTLAPRASEAGTKWTMKWMVWLQDALLTWGLFA